MEQSKSVLILDSPDDWEPWLEELKAHASALEVWELIDPSNAERRNLARPEPPLLDDIRALLTVEAQAALETPDPEGTTTDPPQATPRRRRGRPPSASSSNTARPEGPADAQAQVRPADVRVPARPTDAQVEARHRVEMVKYNLDIQLYLNQKKALGGLVEYIQKRLHPRHKQHTYDKASVYDMLVTLKQKLAPSDFSTQLELRRQYKDIQKPPGRMPIDLYVNKWEEIYNKLSKHSMPEAKAPFPHIDFLEAIKMVAPSFYTANQTEVIRKAKTDDVIPFTDLLDEFRDDRRVYQAKYGKARSGQAAFATLQGQGLPEDQDTNAGGEGKQDTDKNQGKKSKHAPKCICGESHWFRQCPYVLPHLGKKDWTPNPEIQAKFNAADDSQSSCGDLGIHS